jgi:hypothetical protein
MLAADPDALARNLARQFAVYGTARPVAFSDREEIEAIVAASRKAGVRTLIRELVASKLFSSR